MPHAQSHHPSPLGKKWWVHPQPCGMKPTLLGISGIIMLFIVEIYIIYIYTVWVNFITTSLRPNPGIMVSKGNHPPMAELFRWVKYDNLPRYIQHDMIWMCLKMGYTVAQVAYGNLNRENYVQTRGTKDTNIFWAWECVFCLTMYFFCWGGQCWHTSILIHFEAISFRTLFLKWVWPTKG